MDLSDSHSGLAVRYFFRPAFHPAGSPRFLDCSVCARRPLSPRRARWLLFLISSPPALGFSSFGRLALLFGVTRPIRVRFRYGLRFCRWRLRQARLTKPCAPRTTRTMRNTHGELLSVHKNSQAYPGAPKPRKRTLANQQSSRLPMLNFVFSPLSLLRDPIGSLRSQETCLPKRSFLAVSCERWTRLRF